jgi:hypothetical protein
VVSSGTPLLDDLQLYNRSPRVVGRLGDDVINRGVSGGPDWNLRNKWVLYNDPGAR